MATARGPVRLFKPGYDTTRFLRKIGNRTERLSLTISTVRSLRPSKSLELDRMEREISRHRPNDARFAQVGSPFNQLSLGRETYLIDDTEPGRADDTRQTVFPTSSAMSSPPVRSTAKPTGLPCA